MKNTILILVLLIGVVLYSCKEPGPPSEKNTSGETASKNPNLIYYTNNDQKFLIGYPKNWDTVKLNNQFILMARERNDSSQFKSDLTLYKTFLSSIAIIENVLNNSVNDLKKSFGEGSVIYSTKAINENNLPFGLVKASMMFNKKPIISYGVYFIRDKEIFILNLTVLKQKDSLYQPLFDDVINSFDFRN